METTLLLLAGLLPLVAAPLLARLLTRSPLAIQLFDAAVAVIVVGIALFFLLPEAWQMAGAPTILVAALGFAVPISFHRSLHGASDRARKNLFTIAFLGLALHAALDGIALFAPLAEHAAHGLHRENAWGMALAVVLHRLPLALAIWWLASARLGKPTAVALLATIGVATVLGFASGARLWRALPLFGVGLLQATIAGMLVHVIFELHGPALVRAGTDWWRARRRSRDGRRRA